MYLVDVEKLRTIYFNELASGRVKGLSAVLNNEGLSITLNNVKYVFDNDLEITKLGIVDVNENAFVLTTKGYVEFTPLIDNSCKDDFVSINHFTSEIVNLNYIQKQLRERKTTPAKVGIVFFCTGNVCLSEVNDALYLSEKNFVAITSSNQEGDKNLKVFSDDKWWILDVANLERPAVLLIKVDNDEYGFASIPWYCNTIKIRKGSCMYIGYDRRILCL